MVRFIKWIKESKLILLFGYNVYDDRSKRPTPVFLKFIEKIVNRKNVLTEEFKDVLPMLIVKINDT